MSVSLDVLALVGSTLEGLIPGTIAYKLDHPVWLPDTWNKFPTAFYFLLADRAHRLGPQNDEEVEGAVRVELLFALDSLSTVNAKTQAVRAALVAAVPSFNANLLVDVIGVPVSQGAMIWEGDGTPRGYSAIDFLWSSGVVA